MLIKTRHISNFIEKWAPNATKLDYDNTGLLIGNSEKPLKRVHISLDVTPEVIEEAIQQKADLILAHHPLIFKKINRINEDQATGSMIRNLIRHDIDVIAAHTNLDAAHAGVSFELAERLELIKTDFLESSYKTRRLVVLRFPKRLRGEIEAVLNTTNLDTGWSEEEANVAVARFIYDEHRLPELKSKVDVAMAGSPYSIDVMISEIPSSDYGFGVIGELENEMNGTDFITHVSEVLESNILRFSGDAESTIVKKVAVCGGAGAQLISKAFASRADAYITGDIKYHEYFIPKNKLLVDAGHYETEAPIIDKMANELRKAFPGLQVALTNVNTNPVKSLKDFKRTTSHKPTVS